MTLQLLDVPTSASEIQSFPQAASYIMLYRKKVLSSRAFFATIMPNVTMVEILRACMEHMASKDFNAGCLFLAQGYVLSAYAKAPHLFDIRQLDAEKGCCGTFFGVSFFSHIKYPSSGALFLGGPKYLQSCWLDTQGGESVTDFVIGKGD
jgi:hypothetical protein